MIDLDSLSSLVDLAPAPPVVDGIQRRGKQRRRRRRGVATVTALVLVVAAVAIAAAIRTRPSTPHVAAVPEVDRVRVTLLDGSHMEISGPKSLGLTKLTPSFNAELDFASAKTVLVTGHSFSVQRARPMEPGAVLARYATHDGHQLVVYETEHGADGVVRYGDWWLLVTWSHVPTNWPTWAAALSAHETVDGFLVITPANSNWKLNPADAPDVSLGDSLSFFAPGSTYPPACPAAADTTERTPQGWPVSNESGIWWCDATEKVRVHVLSDHAYEAAAIDGLRVTYQPL